MKKFNFNIPEKSLWYLFICGGIILLVVLLGVFPLYKYNDNNLNQIKKLDNQLVAQKVLGPIYLTLLKTTEKKEERLLPNPKKTTISREEAGKFQDVFKTITGKSHLRIVALTPDLSKLAGTPPFLVQSAVLRGEFANFRKMLIELGEVPYLDRIEEISIQQFPDSMEFRLKIWIAIGG
ncbi:MAG: hypothetical protein A2031_02855 [Deltaproteobacteria bacterium RBG_19FT_COMBO_43_11]|nr:MAG: hypothetical protein A2031_02855 [Deltaproteobacteria bacterium RBG_19FT_COMBO_43_11]